MAPLVDEATLLVLASHVPELQRSQQTAQVLTRETFKRLGQGLRGWSEAPRKLMEVVREHLIEFLVRKLGFDSGSEVKGAYIHDLYRGYEGLQVPRPWGLCGFGMFSRGEQFL